MSLEPLWLPELPAWRELLDAARQLPPAQAMPEFVRLAGSRMDFVRAGQLDKAIQRFLAQAETAEYLRAQNFPTVRLALLSSSTSSHLLAGVRLGALRRGFLLEIYTGPYGLYRQELANPESGLYNFRPEVVLFAFDAQHLAAGENANLETALDTLRTCWHTAHVNLQCSIIQQTVLPRLPLLMGNNEDRLQSSPAGLVSALNHDLRQAAREAGVYTLAIDQAAAQDGLTQWFDSALWYSAKQEVHPRASVIYGDQLGRLIAALRGRSAKCLVLDLDNTLWGGVIGDDGVDGIVLGQGSPTGEAFVALQRYAKQLASRGVILAVCSKNDLANAQAPFDSHPEMILRTADISCFVANWQDKAENLRYIAQTLNIGLDALVFVDDNPAERRLVRSELPMVAVPELPEDPAEYVDLLSAAGYFEAVEVTAEDAARTALYRANASREALRQTSTDLTGYLQGLDMQLGASSFDTAGFKRIVQLINKTNQFNLTTRRYTDAEVEALMHDPEAVTLQMRLTDIHGDNGMIGVAIAQVIPVDRGSSALSITTWLMSCRVLGRGVEEATLNLLAERARELGCEKLLGEYRPTPKNAMVADHYGKLGFTLIETRPDGSTRWTLPLDNFTGRPVHMRVLKGETWTPAMSTAS